MFFRLNKDSKETEGFRKIGDSVQYFFRGYVIWNNKLLFGEDFFPVLKEHIINNKIDHNINQYNGLFNIVVIRNNSVKVYNDRWGGFPLYYYQGTGELVISNDWQRILPHLPARKIQKNAALEMHAFGYVMGEKTLVENIYEFLPHTITEIDLIENQFNKNVDDYWQFHYPFTNQRQTGNLEREFSDLWNKQMQIYTDYILEREASAYIPISGGLDSRLLLYYADKAGVASNTMTFGATSGSGEIKTAFEVLGFMQNITESRVLFFNHLTLESLLNSDFDNYDQISCGHFDKKLLYLTQFYPECFYIPGHDANYMAGENIKWQMQQWKNKDDIIPYIFRHKSSSMTSPLIKANSEYYNILYESLQATIPEDDPISSFNRWNGEQRQRRYILRSSIMPLGKNQNILVPFFDYELMDFFIDLPLELLLNQKLYVNTQLKYLYERNPELIKIKRDGKSALKKVRNNYIREYYPKLLNKLKLSSKTSAEFKNWHSSIDWNSDILSRLNLPDYIDVSGKANYYVNTRYLITISEVKTVLEKK